MTHATSPTVDAATRGLKEWAVVVDALRHGDQLILLRKGGIEDVGGEFQLEARAFCLWPTYLHQDTDWLAPHHAHRLARVTAARPSVATVQVDTYAEVAAVQVVPTRAHLDALESMHVWSADYLDLRWRYRPELPLYLLVLRAYRLGPAEREERPEDQGCRSWLRFEPAVDVTTREVVVTDAEFGRRCQAIAEALQR